MEQSGMVTLPRVEYDSIVKELSDYRRDESEKVKNLTSALEAIENGDSYVSCRLWFGVGAEYVRRTVYTKDDTVKALINANIKMEERNLFERIFNV
jgi:hypothetical protein